MQQLVLLGGGHAHLSVLRALARQPLPNVQVTLITPSATQYYSGMVPGWIAGCYTPEQCSVPLIPLVQAADARLIKARVVGMDAQQHWVALEHGQRVAYDYLSLDIGSEVDTSWLQTLGEKLLSVKPLDEFFLRWPKLLDAAKQATNFRLIVVGAGAAGVELAFAARLALTRTACSAQIDLVGSKSGLLPGHATGVRQRVHRQLAQMGIQWHAQTAVGLRDAVLLTDGTELAAHAVLAATGGRAPLWLAQSGLSLDSKNFIAVDAFHRSTSHTNVFAAGDICARVDAPLARSGVHAVHAGPILANNLIAALCARALKPYHPKRRSLYLLACGGNDAILSWGSWSAQGAWVWRWKSAIDRGFMKRFSRSP